MLPNAAPVAAPFPYFGGKSKIAPSIWAHFGPVRNYVDPFAGSLATLLADPYGTPTRTVNDADGFLVNFWRAVQAEPDAVARWADWPVTEIDLFARHAWLVQRSTDLRTRLEVEPDFYDAKIAGWWLWGACSWIGGGWCSGTGPWAVQDDEVVNLRKLPHLGDAGRGVNRKLPHLGDAGRGVNRKLPHLGDAGRGVREQKAAHLRRYMEQLADALRGTRVACGDFARVLTPSVTTRHGLTAVLLDPPYGEGSQEYSAGGNADKSIAQRAWAWAVEHGNDPLLRIAVCGYEDGRTVPEGWTAMPWKARKGYQAATASAANPHREVIWFSPHCLKA